MLDGERSINMVNRPYYLENFSNLTFVKSATPIDYQAVWRDPYLKNMVNYRIITMQFNQIQWYTRTIADIDSIVSQIEDYLGND